MRIEPEVGYHPHFGYCILNKKHIYSDREITERLRIIISDYQEYLVQHHNGKVRTSGLWTRTYFENKEDAENALIWVNSLVFAKDMINKCRNG